MTAPLPPLPAHWFSQLTSSRTAIAPEDEIKDYAKIAVREALERAAKACDLEFAACWTASAMSQAKQAKKCADAIRAMIEELDK